MKMTRKYYCCEEYRRHHLNNEETSSPPPPSGSSFTPPKHPAPRRTPSASGCGSVLEGPYAQLPGGVPLASVGLLAYAAVLFLALGDVDKTRKPLVALTSAMAAASVCLVGLLLFWLNQTCVLCFGSATLCFTNAWLLRSEKGSRTPFIAATVLAALVQFSTVAGNLSLIHI